MRVSLAETLATTSVTSVTSDALRSAGSELDDIRQGLVQLQDQAAVLSHAATAQAPALTLLDIGNPLFWMIWLILVIVLFGLLSTRVTVLRATKRQPMKSKDKVLPIFTPVLDNPVEDGEVRPKKAGPRLVKPLKVVRIRVRKLRKTQ